MKIVVMAAVLAVSCTSPPAQQQLTGAATPREAVDRFLAAARSQDLQAMSVIWGTAEGPARDQIERAELEKRELVMMCFFDHDRYELLSETSGREGVRIVTARIGRGGLQRTTTFEAVEGPSDRWYVLSADLNPVKDFCREPPAGGPGAP